MHACTSVHGYTDRNRCAALFPVWLAGRSPFRSKPRQEQETEERVIPTRRASRTSSFDFCQCQVASRRVESCTETCTPAPSAPSSDRSFARGNSALERAVSPSEGTRAPFPQRLFFGTPRLSRRNTGGDQRSRRSTCLSVWTAQLQTHSAPTPTTRDYLSQPQRYA